MNQAKKITDGALLTAMYIVLLLIIIFVPILILIGFFILPIPFIMYTARHGYRPALLMLFAAFSFTLLFATIVSLPVTLLTGIGGIVIGSAVHKQLKPYETWARGTVGFIVGIILVILLLQLTMNINIYTEIHTMVEQSIDMTKKIFTQIGAGEAELKQLEPIAEQMRAFPDLLPSSIAVTSILMAFVSQWLSYKIMNRTENRKLFFPPFKQLNFPISIIWIYFLALIIMLATMNTTGSLYIVTINIMALVTTLIAIQGYSFIFFYADHKKMHQAIPIIATVVTFLIPFIFMFIIRILGIIDLGFSLKARLANEAKK